MIRFIIAKHNQKVLDDYILSSIKELELDCTYHLIDGNENIFQKYNEGINRIKIIYNEIKDDDLICFVHEDVLILDKNFKEKLEYVFSTKKDIGLVGVVGAKELSDNCAWWLNQEDKLLGHVIQENNDKKYHLVKGGIGFSDKMVAVDGLFFAIRGELLNKGLRFDETFNSFHFYDVSICFQVLQMGYKIGCVDILLQHKSPGMFFLSKEWIDSKNKFIHIVKENGYEFPLNYEKFQNKNI